MEQEIRQVVVGDKDVREPVVIIVCKSHAHAAADVRHNARFPSDILECSVAAVPVERDGQSLEVIGMAVDAPDAVTLPAITITLREPVSIVNDTQTQPTVVNAAKRPRG